MPRGLKRPASSSTRRAPIKAQVEFDELAARYAKIKAELAATKAAVTRQRKRAALAAVVVPFKRPAARRPAASGGADELDGESLEASDGDFEIARRNSLGDSVGAPGGGGGSPLGIGAPGDVTPPAGPGMKLMNAVGMSIEGGIGGPRALGGVLPPSSVPGLVTNLPNATSSFLGGRVGSGLNNAPAVDGAWLVGEMNPSLITSLNLTPGCMIEVATESSPGVVNGTALMRIDAAMVPNTLGRFAEVTFGGASDASAYGALDSVFGLLAPGRQRAILHLCGGPRGDCSAEWPGRAVYHVSTIRTRDPGAITEPWAKQLWKAEVARDLTPASSLTEKVAALKAQMDGSQGVSDRLAGAALLYDTEDRSRKKKKKRSKEKKRRRHSSCSSSSESEADFQLASSRRHGDTIAKVALENPGWLYQEGLKEAARFLGNRGGAFGDLKSGEQAAHMVTYLVSIFHGAHPIEKVGEESSRELRTLAEALDALAQGNLPHLGDLLMQRFKSVESRTTSSSSGISRQLELLPLTGVGLCSVGEQRAAARADLLRLKLEDAKKKTGR
jgi:hypothetical protein